MAGTGLGTRRVVLIVVCATLTLCATATKAAQPVNSFQDLPDLVAQVFEAGCPVDGWIAGKRTFEGSTTDTFADGTSVYLMNCGDAGSVTPFTAIILGSSPPAHEATFHWRLKGRDTGQDGINNAHFGRAPGTIVSSSHSSASCNPEYVHRWNGDTFELIHIDRTGCGRDE